MNYQEVYNSICARARHRETPLGYVEKHHVLPVSLGGSDNPENLVVLTAREHFVAHRLLARITDHPKMWMAFNFMSNINEVFRKPKCSPSASKNYEKERIACAKMLSTMSAGENNPMFGKARPDLVEYNRTRISPLKGKSGALSKTSKPLCVEFTNGDVVFTEVGGEEFARQIGMPTGSMAYCLSTGNGMAKYNIKKAWRP